MPFCEGDSPEALDRFRFAAIKISKGNIDRLKSAIILATTDWRDLRVCADFATDINSHNEWAKTLLYE